MKKTMKKTLAIVLAVFMIVLTIPMTIAATEVANGTAGEGITWVLDSDGTLTVSGTGAMNTEWYAPPWEEYNELIKNVVVEEGITEISASAFVNAVNLVTAFVPSTVTYIGVAAFWSNYSLESINVAEENTTYKDIDGVLFTEDEKTLLIYPQNKSGTEYTIPATVTTIGENAFTGNILIKSLTIPDTVTTLERYAFQYSDLDAITVGNGITEIPEGCFSSSSVKTVIISDSVKTIGYTAFRGADQLEVLIIGSGVETFYADILAYTGQLSVVHYKGTQETWDAISINEENADLNSKVIHFISADSYKAEVAPTCADGHTAGYYCDDCEAYLTGEVIPAIAEHTPGAEVEENVVAPDCTTAGSKDVVTYCTVCGEEASRETIETAAALGHSYENGACKGCGAEDPSATDDPEYNYTFSILEPSRTEIRNKDGIKLHAVIDGTAPAGSYVKWESSNGNFDKAADGNILTVIAKNKGYTTFTAILCAEDGTELARDSVEMYSNSGFFQKIGGFFRSLFGNTTIYEN